MERQTHHELDRRECELVAVCSHCRPERLGDCKRDGWVATQGNVTRELSNVVRLDAVQLRGLGGDAVDYMGPRTARSRLPLPSTSMGTRVDVEL